MSKRKHVRMTELGNNASAIIRDVQKTGTTYEVFKHNKPVALITPLKGASVAEKPKRKPGSGKRTPAAPPVRPHIDASALKIYPWWERPENQVHSSTIAAARWYTKGFDDRLEIRFKDGSVYRYAGVGKSVYEDLMAAESKGQFFHQAIKSFPYRRLGSHEMEDCDG